MTRLGVRSPGRAVGIIFMVLATLSLLWGMLGNGKSAELNRPVAAQMGTQESGSTSSRGTPPLSDQGRSSCIVARVVDGDTLVCADSVRVRLLLIDTPELDQGPFGEVAKVALEGLLPAGERVALETDLDTHDQYDRLLAYLYLSDGRMVNEVLLEMGVAVVSVYPPNVKHVDRFRSIVNGAREARRGLWALGAFDCLPADHRAERC